MRWRLVFLLVSIVSVASAMGAFEDLSLRGEVIEVDLEGSLVVVDVPAGGSGEERLFEVDEQTVIREYVEGSDEPVPIELAELAPGDRVEVRYAVVGGRNVATLILKRNAERA